MRLHRNAKTTPRGRELLINRIRSQGWTAQGAAVAAGVSRRTAFKWLARFRQAGLQGLQDRSSQPRTMPTATKIGLVRRIERLRRKRLTAWEIARKIATPPSTVSRILRRLGLGKLYFLEPKPPVVRYERARPGELLHVDTKKLARIKRVGHRIHGNRQLKSRGVGWEFAHVCVDDHTRLAYVEVRPNEKKESAVGFFGRALEWFDKHGIEVQRVMTDNGSCYRSREFRQLCSEQQVRHIRTRPYTPKTNGKAERFIQTMTRKWAYKRPYRNSALRAAALQPWVEEYNLRRPHRSLGMIPPMARLRESCEQRP